MGSGKESIPGLLEISWLLAMKGKTID